MIQKALDVLTKALNAFTKGVVFGLCIVAAIGGMLYGTYAYIYHIVNPDITHFLTSLPAQSTKIFASDGTMLYEIYDDVKRTYVPLANVNPNALHAIVAIEDKDFYTHNGVSAASTLRSAAMDYIGAKTQYGGSTITQQLVKNAILTPEKSIYRKISEAIWAMEIEKKLSKDQILERYVNQISFGRNTAGIEAASKAYFNKPAKDLTASEGAYLAALIQAPSLYSPTGPNRDTLDGRKDYILQLMYEQGYLDETQYRTAQTQAVSFATGADTIQAPYFVFWIKSELTKQFGEDRVLHGGLQVYTSLDMHLQATAEQLVAEYVKKNSTTYNAHNAGLVAINPKNGQVRAFVGGKDYFGKPEPAGCTVGKNCTFEPNINIPTRLRQPGSSFKPYLYVTAFSDEFKYTPQSIVEDRIYSYGGYVPHNYNTGSQYGSVPIRKALAGSLNLAAVYTMNKIGTEPVIQTLRSVGITAPLQNCGLTLALGACELTLLEHTNGFAIFANMGKYNPVTGVVRIEDTFGKILAQNPPENKQVINPAAAYELIDIMTDNNARSFIFGSHTPLTLPDRVVAAKTGTTNDWKDAWTLGFTPELAVGVWAGNNDGTLLRPGSDGVFVAAPLWHAFMVAALKDVPPSTFEEPFNISRVAMDSRGRIIKPTSSKQKLYPIADYAIPVKAIQPIAPKVLAAEAPTIPTSDSDPNRDKTIILSPFTNSIVYNTPFDVKVYTGTTTEDTNVDLFLDGKHIDSKSVGPFLFTITDSSIKNGVHTLTATSTHFGQFTDTTSIKFRTFFNPGPISPRGTEQKPAN